MNTDYVKTTRRLSRSALPFYPIHRAPSFADVLRLRVEAAEPWRTV